MTKPSGAGGLTAKKYDSEKARVDLLPTLALIETAKVLAFGAEKYGENNWRGGFKWSRLLGALLRHTFAFMRGEYIDEETGLSHMAHAACCVLFLLEHIILGYGTDDRFKEPEPEVEPKARPGFLKRIRSLGR
jgi:hypothetical protein